MQTKPLLYGLIGFFIGGFIVSVAATTFDKPKTQETNNNSSAVSSMSRDDMTAGLELQWDQRLVALRDVVEKSDTKG